MTNDPIQPISEEQFNEVLEQAGVDPSELQAASAPTDRTEPPHQVGDVLYAWQMHVNNGWNIIGVGMPGGATMPLVTTLLPMAWEAFEVAQAHANRNQCQVRLAMFNFHSLAAVVDPNDG